MVVLPLTEGTYHSLHPRTPAWVLGPAPGEGLSSLYRGSEVSVGEQSQALNFREEEETSVARHLDSGRLGRPS